MKQESREALYILAIFGCSFGFFLLGQHLGGNSIQAKPVVSDDSKGKAAAAKLDFCLKNAPTSSNPKEILKTFRLFREMKCPEQLLYSECDQNCRENLLWEIELDLSNWDNYANIKDNNALPLPGEDAYPEP